MPSSPCCRAGGGRGIVRCAWCRCRRARRPQLIRSLAEHLATVGKLPLVDALEINGPTTTERRRLGCASIGVAGVDAGRRRSHAAGRSGVARRRHVPHRLDRHRRRHAARRARRHLGPPAGHPSTALTLRSYRHADGYPAGGGRRSRCAVRHLRAHRQQRRRCTTAVPQPRVARRDLGRPVPRAAARPGVRRRGRRRRVRLRARCRGHQGVRGGVRAEVVATATRPLSRPIGRRRARPPTKH